MNDKIKLIEKLYNEGHITFEDALLLKEDSSSVKKVKKTFDDVVNQVSESCFNDFPTEEIIKYMKSIDWEWALTEVNTCTFIELGTKLIRETLKSMKNYVETNSETDLSVCEKTFGIETGGIKIIGYFNEYGMPEIEMSFIASRGFASCDLDDLRLS